MACKYNKKSSIKAPKKLELIHLIYSNLYSPFPTNLVSELKYFIIFVDDATRMI